MRSRHRVLETHAPQFITSTVVEWLPVFTTAARCDILIKSLEYCRTHKALKVHAFVLLDYHLHAILAAPDLSRVLADFKRHTARRLIEQLQTEGCDWLLNQLRYFRSHHKAESEYQFWQEGFHPQSMFDDEVVRQKIDYIHNNPVKRGLVSAPEHWRYSSAHEWCPGVLPVMRCDPLALAEEAQLPRQGRSQVQLGNEGRKWKSGLSSLPSAAGSRSLRHGLPPSNFALNRLESCRGARVLHRITVLLGDGHYNHGRQNVSFMCDHECGT